MSSLTNLEHSTPIVIEYIKGRLVIDSRVVAGRLNIKHKNFLETIKKYEPVMRQRFGTVTFETEASIMPNGSKNPSPEKFCWLTEDQSIFLMTLSRNTDQVVDCKINLVDAFALARKSSAQHQIPQTLSEALRLAADLAEAKDKLTAKIEQDAPLVAFAETVQASDDAIDFNSFAKAINTGRTRLFRVMRECGVIMKNTTLPYQRWVDAGYFEVSQEVTEDGRLCPYALVTGKGQIWLKQKIDAHMNQQQQFVNLITQGVLGF